MKGRVGWDHLSRPSLRLCRDCFGVLGGFFQETVLHVINVVGKGDECFSVRNDDDCHLTFHCLKRFSNFKLASHIDLTRGFIQNKDFWFAKDGSC